MTRDEYLNLLNCIQRSGVMIRTHKEHAKNSGYDEPILISQFELNFIDKTLEIAFGFLHDAYSNEWGGCNVYGCEQGY